MPVVGRGDMVDQGVSDGKLTAIIFASGRVPPLCNGAPPYVSLWY